MNGPISLSCYTCSRCGAFVWDGIYHQCGGFPYVTYGVTGGSTFVPPEPSLDPEIRAMSVIAAALEPLDAAARARVIDWAVSRFGGAD